MGVKKNDKFLPRATGFFVGVEEEQFVFPYIVTAEHVVSGLLTSGQDIYCRFNRTDGKTEELEIPPDHWLFHPDESKRTDVAICGYIPSPEIDFNFQPLNGNQEAVATETVIERQQFGLGEEIYIVGLFRSHFGTQRNIPIVRIGNISAMRDEPVWTEYCGFVEAYLIEATIHLEG